MIMIPKRVNRMTLIGTLFFLQGKGAYHQKKKTRRVQGVNIKPDRVASKKGKEGKSARGRKLLARNEIVLLQKKRTTPGGRPETNLIDQTPRRRVEKRKGLSGRRSTKDALIVLGWPSTSKRDAIGTKRDKARGNL